MSGARRTKRLSSERVELLKEYFLELCEPAALDERKKELKKLKASKAFSFVDLQGPKTKITETKVQKDRNFEFLKGYLGSFGGDLPTKLEVQAALQWISENEKINEHFSEPYQHEAWARTEGNLVRQLASYVCNLRQRNRATRKGHERMAILKTIVGYKLQERGVLMENGRKVPTKGRSTFQEITSLNQALQDISKRKAQAQGLSQALKDAMLDHLENEKKALTDLRSILENHLEKDQVDQMERDASRAAAAVKQYRENKKRQV